MGMARQASSAAQLDRRFLRAQPAALPLPEQLPLGDLSGDRFFRHLVLNLRTGVVAITLDGRIAAMNDMAYRVLGLSPRPHDIGRPFAETLHDYPEIVSVLQQAFESDDLPNRLYAKSIT